jgi:hypothetical protein
LIFCDRGFFFLSVNAGAVHKMNKETGGFFSKWGAENPKDFLI